MKKSIKKVILGVAVLGMIVGCNESSSNVSNTNTSRKSYTCPSGKTCLAYIVSTDNRTYVQIGSYGYTMGHYTNNSGYSNPK